MGRLLLGFAGEETAFEDVDVPNKESVSEEIIRLCFTKKISKRMSELGLKRKIAEIEREKRIKDRTLRDFFWKQLHIQIH